MIEHDRWKDQWRARYRFAYPTLLRGSFGRSLSLQLAQIAEATNGQAAGVLHALFGQPANVPREIAPRSLVQIMSGHAAIDLDRSNERFCDFDLKHFG